MCGIFINRVLSSGSDEQPRGMTWSCIVCGTSEASLIKNCYGINLLLALKSLFSNSQLWVNYLAICNISPKLCYQLYFFNWFTMQEVCLWVFKLILINLPLCPLISSIYSSVPPPSLNILHQIFFSNFIPCCVMSMASSKFIYVQQMMGLATFLIFVTKYIINTT